MRLQTIIDYCQENADSVIIKASGTTFTLIQVWHHLFDIDNVVELIMVVAKTGVGVLCTLCINEIWKQRRRSKRYKSTKKPK